MIRLSADNLVASLSSIALFGVKIRDALKSCDPSVPEISIPDPEHFFLLQASLHVIEEEATKIEMPISLAAVWRCKNLISGFQTYGSGVITKATSLNNLAENLSTLSQVFSDELSERLLLVMSTKHTSYYSDRAHFGAQVEEAFPSGTYDIAEAAKCRALGRWTACVMHTMRVLETGLMALASHLNVEHGDNWNTLLNKIESAAREVGKRTHGQDAEQWTAEAGTHFRFIKNAWRNHAMHRLEKYDEERAIAIFENGRSCMQHLAGRLSDDQNGVG